jgi:sugar phosphate isomerase/epimerase
MLNRLEQVCDLAEEVHAATGTRSVPACADLFHRNIEEDDLSAATVAAGPFLCHVHVAHTLECRLRGDPQAALPATARFLRQFEQ